MFSFFKKKSPPPITPQPEAPAILHRVFHRALAPPYPKGMERAIFGMGCFWGAEKKFWLLANEANEEAKHPALWITATGYAGGSTSNPAYEEVCKGHTGHFEAVLVVFDPSKIPFERLLATFWENHDPTQGMRQGNDIGSQYRSVIGVFSPEQHQLASDSYAAYAQALNAHGLGPITTQITEQPDFYFAEEYHQQYLDKNKDGYCGLGGTGVSCPIGTRF